VIRATNETAVEWPTANIPASQLLAMARYREEIGNECNATGDYPQARRHWIMAETYRDLARAPRAAQS